MSNQNHKISTPPKPKEGFTKQEKQNLFAALSQIVMNQDRILRAMNIKTDGEETFYDELDESTVNSCMSLIKDYLPQGALENDVNEE